MDLTNAVVYDIETFPNCFTFAAEYLHTGEKGIWEVSFRRDDRASLVQWLQWFAQTRTPMIGFNNVHFDYPVIHSLFHNPNLTVDDLYRKAMSIISSEDRFSHTVWVQDRFAPQIDLFKMSHFDNKAKATSLKWLEVNMRSDSVVDMPVPVGSDLTSEQIDQYLIPYNYHDVAQTKKFAEISHNAIEFRRTLVDQFGEDVMNWNDPKIGEQMVIQKLGQELCYDRSSGRRVTRQSVRDNIPINEIIFPYVQFENPEFQRVLDYLREQTLKKDEFSEKQTIKTKGVFTNLSARVGGIDFNFGVGGIHGSIERKRFQAKDGWVIKDVDVASLYPSIAIQNRLAPEHLGEPFVSVYSELPQERRRWQKEKGKKCVEANALKLASNGTYGKSNSIFSPFYDPKFTMTITINGQLLLCMLAEQLVKIPSLQIIQINTDGITYFVHENALPHTVAVEKWWQDLTKLTLEEVFCNRMWIRDVNSYVAEGLDGSLKQKGAYWFPDPMEYGRSMAETQPPAWHKNLSNIASVRAAVAHMTLGVDIRTWLLVHSEPFDFLCAIKAKGSDILIYNGEKTQKTVRYYVTTAGAELVKKSPPKGLLGAPKKANGVSDLEYKRVMDEVGWVWDERVCTKNNSVYEERQTSICAGHKVKLCNDIRDFDWKVINYDWYVAEAEKLVV